MDSECVGQSISPYDFEDRAIFVLVDDSPDQRSARWREVQELARLAVGAMGSVIVQPVADGFDGLWPQGHGSLLSGLGAVKMDDPLVQVNGLNGQASTIGVPEAAVDPEEYR